MLYFLAVKTGVTEGEYYAFSAAYGRVMGAFTALAWQAMMNFNDRMKAKYD